MLGKAITLDEALRGAHAAPDERSTTPDQSIGIAEYPTQLKRSQRTTDSIPFFVSPSTASLDKPESNPAIPRLDRFSCSRIRLATRQNGWRGGRLGAIKDFVRGTWKSRRRSPSALLQQAQYLHETAP